MILIMLLLAGCQKEDESKQFVYDTRDVNKQYEGASGSYVDLLLTLPQLQGDFKGIPAINEYYNGLESFYYNELPEIPEDIDYKISGIDSGYYVSADYKFEYMKDNILSISAYLDGGAGGVSWAGLSGDTFNLETGEKLTLDQIFKVSSEEYRDKVFGLIADEISKAIEEEVNNGNGNLFFFDDPYTGDGYKAISESFDSNNFYLTQDALILFYPKYALAAGAAGPLSFKIPYESLEGMLNFELKTP